MRTLEAVFHREDVQKELVGGQLSIASQSLYGERMLIVFSRRTRRL